MDINTKEDDNQEYGRINEELTVRLNNCYSDGAMLASFFLIYYATMIVGLIQCINLDSSELGFIILGVVPLATFFFPIIILHSFAEKYKENLLGLLNIALFSSIYHEKPVCINNKICGKKWELLHKNTRSFSHKHESKEYFFLAFASIVLMVVSFMFDAYLFFLTSPKSTLIIVLGVVFAILYIIVLYGSIKYLKRIHIATDIKRFEKLSGLMHKFYKWQKDKLCVEQLESNEFEVLLSEIKEKEVIIDKCIENDKYPYTKSEELMDRILAEN